MAEHLVVVDAASRSSALLVEHPPGQVADRHRHVAVAEVDAGDDAGPAGEPYRGTAPAAAGLGVDQALAGSSRTMLETVAGARPVARASSAWVKTPSVAGSVSVPLRVLRSAVRSVGTPRTRTRCWLAVRSEAFDPGEGSMRWGGVMAGSVP